MQTETAEKLSVHKCQNLAVLDQTFNSIYQGPGRVEIQPKYPGLPLTITNSGKLILRLLVCTVRISDLSYNL